MGGFFLGLGSCRVAKACVTSFGPRGELFIRIIKELSVSSFIGHDRMIDAMDSNLRG